jgi:endonuclease/exonuclease/phosphatase family metal-dependent hydrolase
MFRFLFLAFIAVLQPPQPTKAISYNIRYNNPQDGNNVWENRRATVAALLQEENADFIGLQEVVHPQLVDLVQALTEYHYTGVGREDGITKGEYSPIFFKKEKYKLLQGQTFWLSETPDKISKGWDAALERICTYGLFLNLKTQQKLWVFNTHFDHRGTLARSKSADLILQKIQELNGEKLPVILTGDFNLTPDSAPIKKIQSQMTDIQQNLPASDPQYATSNGFDTEKRGTKRIDYIFTKGFKTMRASHRYQKTPMGGWASDHHPVIALVQQ